MTAVTPPAPSAALGSPWAMVRTLVGVGILSGLVIVSVFEVTAPVIADNRAEALRKAVFEVLPGARRRVTFAWSEGDGFRPVETSDGPRVEAAYDERGELVGFAIEASGMGYADVIRVLYGYSLDEQAVVGLQVLESRETPGLGDKIMTDEAFQASFARLDVSLDESGESLAHRIEAVAAGTRESPWEVDSITGATISSVAVTDMVRRSAETWVPRLVAASDELRDPPAAPPSAVGADADASEGL